MQELTIARLLAKVAHAGQKDQAGEDYVDGHLYRVAGDVLTYQDATVAWLHDIVEDTVVTLSDLRAAGFVPQVVEAVDALTRREGEVYADYITRIAHGGTAARDVKLADLRDHLRDTDAISASLVARYERAVRTLTPAY